MKKQDRLENRLSWRLTVAWMLFLLVILSACGANDPQTPPEPTAMPTAVTATETATARPTAEAEFFTGGGTYDDEQQKMIDSFLENGPDVPTKMQEWGRAFTGYLKYWVGSNKVSADLLKNVPIQWFWDESDPHNPDKVTACIDIPAFGGDCFSVPIVNGKPQMTPPTEYVNGQNEAGQGPLPITKSSVYEDGTQYFAGSEDGKWVRKDKPTNEKGRIVERVSEGGEWPSEVAKSLGYPYMPYSRIEGGKLIDLNGVVWAHQDEKKAWVGEFVHHESMWGIPDVYTKDIYTKSIDIATISADKIPTVKPLISSNSNSFIDGMDGISLSDLILEKISMKEVLVKGVFRTYKADLTFSFKSGNEVHEVTFEAVGVINNNVFTSDSFPLVPGGCYQPIVGTMQRKLEIGEYFQKARNGRSAQDAPRAYVFGNGSLVTTYDLLSQMNNNLSSFFGGDSVMFMWVSDPASPACTK